VNPPEVVAPARFPAVSRVLHRLMAAMVLAMLFLGMGMAASVSARCRFLVAIHRPLGIAILLLVAIRWVDRLINPPPPSARSGYRPSCRRTRRCTSGCAGCIPISPCSCLRYFSFISARH
jgi:cytochrome b561